jgi:hypothetical protein
MTERTLYERLGGAFAIAAVIDRFSDAIVKNPVVGQSRRIRPSGMAHHESGQASWTQIHAHAFGYAMFLSPPLNTRPPSQAALYSVWRWLIAS